MDNEFKMMVEIDNKKLLHQIEIMKLNMAAQIEFYKIFAVIHRAKFVSLTNAGYSEAQAMDLCGKF